MGGWIRSNLRRLMIAFLCVVVLITGTGLYLFYSQPEVCALCGSGSRDRYHAPVIVNLATGQRDEMRIYDSALPGAAYEIATVQNTGTFSFASCAGLVGRLDTCWHTCTVDIPKETKKLRPSHFCSDCREMLKSHSEEGFVLADLYAEDTIEVYPIMVGSDYTIRDYKITVAETDDPAEIQLVVLGQAEGLIFVD